MVDNQENSLGSRLKKLRKERKISQSILAELSGIALNSISLIERDKTSPSIATLQSLASALDVRMSYFFEESGERNVLHIKEETRPSLNSQGVNIETLGGRLHGQHMEPFLVNLEPGSGSGDQAVIHAGHEIVYCLEGSLQYTIDGEEYIINKGDFFLFEAQMPHQWRNPFDTPAKFILILQTCEPRFNPVQRHFADYPSIQHIG